MKRKRPWHYFLIGDLRGVDLVIWIVVWVSIVVIAIAAFYRGC